MSTTSKEAVESEVRTVVAVDGATLTLDTALEFQHLGEFRFHYTAIVKVMKVLNGEFGFHYTAIVKDNESFEGQVLTLTHMTATTPEA